MQPHADDENSESYNGVTRPKFTQEIKDKTCPLGDTVTFTIQCEGRPSPTLSWSVKLC